MTRRLLNAGIFLALTFTLNALPVRADGSADNGASIRFSPTVRAIQRVVPSTVNIHSEKQSRSPSSLHPTGKKVNGMGTGIIVDERGYIVTNYHVVQDVDSLQVTLHDNTTYSARVVSFDSREDLAVIKISANRDLPVMPLGTSSDLMLGEDVLAVGNAFGYPHTVTRGIVSALGRDVEVNEEQAYRNLVQIDAAINPGNSGGPLINLNGELIAINVAIRAGAQKIGFAIPIDDARRTIARLLDIERLNQTFHGLAAHDFKQGAERKLIVDSAAPNSPAAAAGLQAGDILVKAGETDVTDLADFERALLGRNAGESIELVVRRGSDEQQLSLSVARLNGSRSVAGHQRVQTAMTVTPTAAATTVSPPPSTGDRTWDMLGLKLQPLPSGNDTLEGQSYRGGMIVADVRSNSPATSNGIRKGDVLVGLHVWETVTQKNVDYVLENPQLRSFSPLKFYILREKETLYGHFQVAAR
ncbi:MAG: trypsin-like peptidase domain-containing protein [Planctomycetaceae bacterium]